MKAETKLNKIMSMEDSITKRMKLFEFACHVMPGCQLHKIATAEWSRLNKTLTK